MQLYISTEGLYEPVKNILSDVTQNLSVAKSTAINAPYGFQYSNYVNQLDGTIKNLIREANEIDSIIRQNENRYEDLFNDEIRKVRYINEKKLEERIGFRM